MKNQKHTLLIIWLFPLWGLAQTTPPVVTSEGLKIVGKYFGDSLVLRIAPLRPGVWYNANKVGYQIERQEFSEAIFEKSVPFVKVNQQPLKPLPLEQWKPLVGDPSKPNRYAAIAAQSIYGKPSGQAASLTERADLLLNNYSMALLAAEFSPIVANAEGLRLVDKGIKPNKSYRYRVFILPQQLGAEKIDTAYVVINTGTILPTPATELKEVKTYQDRIELYWERAKHESFFSGYFIERSEDNGKTYRRLNESPYISMDTQERTNHTYFVYQDSIKVLYKPYHYRLVGITTFGEVSTPSKPLVGMSKDQTPPNQPQNVKARHLGGSKIEISWGSKNVRDLKGFMIGRSTRTDVKYQPISPLLTPGARSFIDTTARHNSTNYYIVVAVDTAGNGSASLYAYGAMRDTVPPGVPKGLQGTIDTNGVVTLRWRHSPESDVKGYKIIYANSSKDRYLLASKELIRDSVWRDTLNLRTLTKKIYYKIMAVDLLDNYSAFSPPVELTKPDKVPPVSPHLKDFYVNADGIRLKWVTSTSKDVVKHQIQRKKTTQSRWELVTTQEFKGNPEEEFLDKTVEPQTTYQYQIAAIDESNLISLPSETITLKSGDFRKIETVKNLKVTYDKKTETVNISWEKGNSENYVLLYKSNNSGSYSTLSRFSGSVTNYSDKQVNKGNTYLYTAKLMRPDGRTSAFSPEVSVSISNQ